MYNKKTTKINWNLKSEKEGRCYDMVFDLHLNIAMDIH